MPRTEKKSMEELLELLKITNQKQELLEEEIQKLNKNVEAILLQITSQQTREHNCNTETLIEHVKTQFEYLENIKKSHIQDEAYRMKKRNLRMWNNLLNRRKLAYFNAIKNKETAKIYKSFIEMEEIFIPRKFREKINSQDTEKQKQIKNTLSLTKMQAQIEIQEDKTIHFTKKYTEIDNKLFTKIKELCPKETHRFLSELWESKCKKEEEKSLNILERKITWLKALPEKEKLENETKPKKTVQTHQKTQYSTQNNHQQIQRKPPNRVKNPNTYYHTQTDVQGKHYNPFYHTQTHPKTNSHNTYLNPFYYMQTYPQGRKHNTYYQRTQTHAHNKYIYEHTPNSAKTNLHRPPHCNTNRQRSEYTHTHKPNTYKYHLAQQTKPGNHYLYPEVQPKFPEKFYTQPTYNPYKYNKSKNVWNMPPNKNKHTYIEPPRNNNPNFPQKNSHWQENSKCTGREYLLENPRYIKRNNHYFLEAPVRTKKPV